MGQVPRNVNDAVSFIKKAGKQLVLVVLRGEAGLGQLSRAGSARSFNTTFGPGGSRPGSRPATPHSSDGEEEARRQQVSPVNWSG